MPAAKRRITLLDAPSNLGLRPPAPDAAPGVYKLAGALRDHGLLERLSARDGGVVVPPRYHSGWEPGDGVRNEPAIERYSRRLADRVAELIGRREFPAVLGGDCSILLGNMLAVRRSLRGGLVFIDGHSDFRHPDNSDFVGAAAGENLALATGRGGALADLEGLGPLVGDQDVVVVGVRSGDEARDELRESGIALHTSEDVLDKGAPAVARAALDGLQLGELDGFWIHCDADVLDSSVMPAVDTPEPGGLDFGDLSALLGALLSDERAIGLEITIFDPDLDETGELAAKLTNCICDAFTGTETRAR
jgi:arginase